MGKIIKLSQAVSDWTTEEIYINTDHIDFFRPRSRKKGSAIIIIDYPGAIEVTETPEEILALMEGEK